MELITLGCHGGGVLSSSMQLVSSWLRSLPDGMGWDVVGWGGGSLQRGSRLALICFPPTPSAGELRRRLRLSSLLDFQLTLLLCCAIIHRAK